MFKNFKPRTPSGLDNITTNNNPQVYKASKEHNDIYWFGMGGLYHPYVQLRIHDTILFIKYNPFGGLQTVTTSLHQYSTILMLTKKELLPNGIPPSESTQKNLTIRLTQ